MRNLNYYRIKLLSIITFGETKKHYNKKLSKIKVSSKKNMNCKVKQAAPDEDKLNINRLYSAALVCNKIFKEYQNKYTGKDIALIATGPTLNYAGKINDNIDCIGVNKAFKFSNIKLKYLFAMDYMAVGKYIEDIVNYEEIEKFYGYFLIKTKYPQMMIPECVAYRHNAKRFVCSNIWTSDVEQYFNYFPDISSLPLHAYSSTIIPAMQFALYTNPKRIYLYGCDCSNTGHFDEPDKKLSVFQNSISDEWRKIAKIVSLFYPETEIISVNPVGLKGLFKDVYTKEYLSENPYINKNDIEILNERN